MNLHQLRSANDTAGGNDTTQQYYGIKYLQKRSPRIEFSGTLSYPPAESENQDQTTVEVDNIVRITVKGDMYSVNTVAMPDLSQKYRQIASRAGPDLFSRFDKVIFAITHNDPQNIAVRALGLTVPSSIPQRSDTSIPTSYCIPRWSPEDYGCMWPENVPTSVAEKYVPDIRQGSTPTIFWKNYDRRAAHSISHNMRMRFLPDQSLLRDSTDSDAKCLMTELHGGEDGVTVSAETSMMIEGQEVLPDSPARDEEKSVIDVWAYRETESLRVDSWRNNEYAPLPIIGEVSGEKAVSATTGIDESAKPKTGIVARPTAHRMVRNRGKNEKSGGRISWWTRLTGRSSDSSKSSSDRERSTGSTKYVGWKRSRS
ncbi:hypothetical protein I317_01906 [Kwoniella heveanensis CBS 569]|nr:hypothetical protein I317_01906 [Kwoniella heveanensis CBS 569]